MPSANINDTVTSLIDSGKKYVQAANAGTPTPENLALFKVGKPCSFPTSIDQNQRIKKYIESKMNIIDLIPCTFKLPLTKALETKNWKDQNVVVDSIKPEISYTEAIEKFVNICSAYNLPSNYGGLRLFLTDDTTSTDEFTNSYQDNWLGSAFNKFADARNQLGSITRSLGSDAEKLMRSILDTIGEGTQVVFNTVLGASEKFGEGSGREGEYQNLSARNIAGGLGRAAMRATEIIATGNKLSLPKVWSDSSYSPNFTAVVKLVSPYGHPDAIREFIIKPLMYLMILASARSRDKISYGQGPKLTVKAYGITHLPLATISGLSLRKGGGDTSYNIYRQPLSIDVSLTFQSLIPGFAVEESPSTNNRFRDFQINENMRLPTVESTFFSNLGTIIESIKPVAISDISRDYIKGNGLPGDDLAYNESVFAIEGKALADARKDKANLRIAALQSQNQPPIIPKTADSLVATVAETANRAAGESAKLQASAARELVKAQELYNKSVESSASKNFQKLVS